MIRLVKRDGICSDFHLERTLFIYYDIRIIEMMSRIQIILNERKNLSEIKVLEIQCSFYTTNYF